MQCEIAGGKLESITLVPCQISGEGQPHPIDRAKDGALWDEWYDFVVASCRGVGCDTELVKVDGAVRVTLPAG